MYANHRLEITPITNDEVPIYQTTKSVTDGDMQMPDANSVVQFVINLEDEAGQEFYLNGQDELSPLTSEQCNPKLIGTTMLQQLLNTIRSDYASGFLVYALTKDEFCQRRAKLRTAPDRQHRKN